MVICKVCKSSGKQGEIFIIEEYDKLETAICDKFFQPERLSEKTSKEDAIV
jgi:hypothetical protein